MKKSGVSKETLDELIDRHTKEIEELQSTNEATDITEPAPETEGKKSADVDKPKEEEIDKNPHTPETKAQYEESDIEIIEEDIGN